MTTDKLRRKIQNGEEYFGLYISLADPTVMELAVMAGYDFVRIDLEHSLFSQAELRELIRTATALGLPAFVRVPSLSYVCALLDMGASGIIAPHIDSKEAAIKAVEEVKYAPLGLRGMAAGQRCTRYGATKLSEYMLEANEDTLLCVQIEDKEGVEHIDEILSVDGIDMVSSGKNDLSQSYGLPGQNSHPTIISAEEEVIKQTFAHKKQPILLVSNKARKQSLVQMGVQGFMIGRDTQLLRDAMMEGLRSYRDY